MPACSERDFKFDHLERHYKRIENGLGSKVSEKRFAKWLKRKQSRGSNSIRILTHRETEFCGSLDKHPYELYPQLNDIEHTKTKAKGPQTNGICKRVYQTILNKFYRVTFRKKVYSDLETLQMDLNEYMNEYNYERTHQGKRCQGRIPMETFLESKKYFVEKNLSESLAA